MRKISFQNRADCFCAFCRSPRKIYTKRHIGPINILLTAVAASLMMYSIWEDFDPRAIYLFIALLVMAEAFVQLRWRMHIVCKSCDFDPVLYIRDPKRASARVKEALVQRKGRASSLLARPLNLPSLTQKRAGALKLAEEGQRGVLVSKQV